MASFMPDEDRQAVTPRDTYRSSGPLSINLGSPQVTERSSASIQTGDGSYGADLASNEYDRIISTAKSATGSPIGYRRELRDDDLVSIHGMDVTVKVARSMGLLDAGDTPNRDALADLTREETPKEITDGIPEEALPGPAEDDLGMLIAGTSATDQVTALSEMIEFGEMSLDTLEHAASQLGVPPDALVAKVATIRSAFEQQATEAVSKAGVVDVEAFWAWARDQREGDLKAAMKAHGMDRSTAGYQALAAEFTANLDTFDPEAILTAEFGEGISARRHGGRVLVTIDGREMPWSVAIKTGLIQATPV